MSRSLPPSNAATLPAAAPISENAHLIYEAWLHSEPRRRRSGISFWLLVTLAFALHVAVLALAAYLLFSTTPAHAPTGDPVRAPLASTASLWNTLRTWPVQEDGRIKPLDTFAREAVRTITGRERFQGNDPVALLASWLLSDAHRLLPTASGGGFRWEDTPIILCDFPALRQGIYQEERGADETLSDADIHGTWIEPGVLHHSRYLRTLARQALVKRMEDGRAALSPLEEKARQVHERLELYERIRQGRGFAIVGLDAHASGWFSLHDLRQFSDHPEQWQRMLEARSAATGTRDLTQPMPVLPASQVKRVLMAFGSLHDAYRDAVSSSPAPSAPAPVRLALAEWITTLEQVNAEFHQPMDSSALSLELWFNHAAPFQMAWVGSALTAVLLGTWLLTGARWPLFGRCLYRSALVAYVICLGCAALGFYCRVRISGRPPVSNMYESIVWVGFMTSAFGLLLEAIYRRGFIAGSAALVSTLVWILGDQLPLTFSPAIQPLQAVLRSNYWLVIHVLTIVSSYSAFALAWGLGNFNLGLMILAPARRDLMRMLSQFCYRAIQIGVVLLAAGTLLGGFWAAESWGRFWGWDPKEVWALIALLCYLIPLHARYTGWVKDFGLAVAAVVCFASVVMAWYGVNFILGAGLHSYGFGGGRTGWVYWAGLLNLDLVVLASLRYLYFRPSWPALGH